MASFMQPPELVRDLAKLVRRVDAIERRLRGGWTRIAPYNSGGAPVEFGLGWTHYDLSGWGPAEYRKVGDEVQLRGSLNPIVGGGAGVASILVFAPGWRPGINAGWVAPYHTAIPAYLQLNAASGVLSAVNAALGWLPLDQMRFSTAPRTAA